MITELLRYGMRQHFLRSAFLKVPLSLCSLDQQVVTHHDPLLLLLPLPLPHVVAVPPAPPAAPSWSAGSGASQSPPPVPPVATRAGPGQLQSAPSRGDSGPHSGRHQTPACGRGVGEMRREPALPGQPQSAPSRGDPDPHSGRHQTHAGEGSRDQALAGWLLYEHSWGGQNLPSEGK